MAKRKPRTLEARKPPQVEPEPRWWRLVPPVLLGTTFILMAALSWGHWPDVLIDFGRELYTPWRITQGEVLYRDIAAFYGPLSAYVNAGVFWIFGASLLSLVWFNLLITGLMTWLIYALMTHISGRIAATAGAMMFLLAFAFGQYLNTGNYNFITPYSHEAMHGCVLAFGTLLCVWKFLSQRLIRWTVLTGLLAGLTFITKPEAFLSLTTALTCVIVLTSLSANRDGRMLVHALGVGAVAFVVPLLVAFALLATGMSASQALQGVLGSWPFLFDRTLTDLPFFRSGMGFDEPESRVQEMLIGLAAYLAMLGPAGLIAMFVTKSGYKQIAVGAVLGAVTAITVWMAWAGANSWAFTRPLPAITAAAGIGSLVWFLRCRNDPMRSSKAIIQVAFCALAMTYLLKMILKVQIAHYGFILALPATLVMIATLSSWLPRLIERAGGAGNVVRVVVLCALAVIGYKHVEDSRRVWATHTFIVGKGGDAFWTNARGMDELLGGVLKWIDQNTQPQDTMVVIPEGVMLNYLTRRPSTIPVLTMLPSDFIMFGESAVLNSLKANPPDYFVIVHRPTEEYGATWLGRDYGVSVMDWVYANYEPVAMFGQPPLNPQSVFGVGIMKRK